MAKNDHEMTSNWSEARKDRRVQHGDEPRRFSAEFDGKGDSSRRQHDGSL